MHTTARMRALRREQLASDCVPYSAQVAEHVATTSLLDYVQVFRLAGASFETADDDRLNNWHERLNVLWRNVASTNVALWTHIIRRRESIHTPSHVGSGFGDKLCADYYERLSRESLMTNELYLSVVFRPVSGLPGGLLSKGVFRRRGQAPIYSIQEALADCDKLAQVVKASLARYEPQPLGTYRLGSVCYSQLLEFLALLINGEWQRIPLMHAPANELLVTTRLLFGHETVEYRMPTAARVGAMLGVKEYCTPSVVGMFNRLLSAPFPFILTQSFSFLSKAAAQGTATTADKPHGQRR